MAGRFGAIGSNLSVGAGQSVRRNAADDGFEAFTPEAAGAETDPVFAASEAAEFEAGDKSKLDGIETGADVTDATNVKSALSGETLTGALVAADHGTEATAQVGNICYGTSATPPTASGTPEGTLYVQYTA